MKTSFVALLAAFALAAAPAFAQAPAVADPAVSAEVRQMLERAEKAIPGAIAAVHNVMADPAELVPLITEKPCQTIDLNTKGCA